MKRCRVARLFVLASMIGAVVAVHAQTYSVLYNFGTQPGRPWGENAPGLIAQGRNGLLYSAGGGGGGVVLIDFDGDGLLDIFVPGGGHYDKNASAEFRKELDAYYSEDNLRKMLY